MNWIYLLIAALALGLFLELLKGLHRSKFAESKQPALTADANLVPFHVSEAKMRAEEARARARAAAAKSGIHLQANATKSYDFSGGKVAAADPNAAPKKKKKKKKAADKAKAEVVQQQPVTPLTPPPPSTPDNSVPPGGVVGAGKEVPVAGGGGASRPNEYGYEYWATQLLGAPNPTGVNELIADYHNHLVTPQVFYEVLTAMAAEPNSQQQALALLAASKFPSAESFEFLATTLQTDASNTATVNLDVQYLNTYQSLGQVQDLKAVMSMYSTNQNIILDAAQELSSSTATYLANRNPTATNGPTTGGAAPPTLAQLQTAYSGFVPVLQALMKAYAQNAQISGLLNSSLVLISNL